MNHIGTIARNYLRVFLRDKMSYAWLVGMPLMFTVIMGIPNFGGNRKASNFTPGLRIENQDTGYLGRVFVEELTRAGVWVVGDARRNEAKFIVRVPADFTARVLGKERAKVELAHVEGADPSQRDLVEFKLAQTVFIVNARLIEHAIGRASADPPTEESLRAVLARVDPVSVDARFAGRRPVPAKFNQSLPATLVMYLLINLVIYGGASTASEREQGVLRRISVHPVTRTQLVFGKVFGLLLLALVPIVVLLTVGQVALGVNVIANVHWIVLTLLVFSWVAGSFGLLIGFVVKSPEKIVALGVLIGLPMAALGGCWWPLEVVPEWIQTVAHVTPVAWAMDALHQFISFGGGIETAAGALGVLALFGVAANLAAMKFFRV